MLTKGLPIEQDYSNESSSAFNPNNQYLIGDYLDDDESLNLT